MLVLYVEESICIRKGKSSKYDASTCYDVTLYSMNLDYIVAIKGFFVDIFLM